MASAVPRPTLGPTGFLVPTEANIRVGVFIDFNGSFGGNLNPASSTPQGQLADSETAVIGYNNDIFLAYANQVDPAFSSGRMQDGIARIYFLFRIAAKSTVVLATCGGASGTILPAGSLGRAADGTVYSSLSLVTIPLSGTIDTEFAAVTTGPIACPAGTLSTIYRAVPGWDTITNASDGIIGRDVETRADFETRRQLSVSVNANGILAAIRGQVLSVAGVLDAYVLENATSGSVSVGGITMGPNSLYVAAVGGTDADVARAIWTKKAPGCDYYAGNTTVTVEDRNGYVIPYPSYSVVFERPASLPIYFDVEIATSASVPSDAETQVKKAIIAAFNGQQIVAADGTITFEGNDTRARIGGTIFASSYTCPVASLGTWARIKSIKIGTSGPGAADTVTPNIDKQPTITAGNITVNIT